MNEITPTTRLCPKCDAAVPLDAKFCPACGVAQGAAQKESSREIMKEFASGTLTEAKSSARDILRNKDVQKIAAGAALGAVIAPVIPFVSVPVGAVLGGGYALFRRITR